MSPLALPTPSALDPRRTGCTVTCPCPSLDITVLFVQCSVIFLKHLVPSKHLFLCSPHSFVKFCLPIFVELVFQQVQFGLSMLCSRNNLAAVLLLQRGQLFFQSCNLLVVTYLNRTMSLPQHFQCQHVQRHSQKVERSNTDTAPAFPRDQRLQ